MPQRKNATYLVAGLISVVQQRRYDNKARNDLSYLRLS